MDRTMAEDDDSRRDPAPPHATPYAPPPAPPRATPSAFPRLRLRTAADELFDLPWEVPLADWPDEEHRFRTLPVAMAWLLVDLHRGGVYWGDCSLANTLFRRDGDRMQAYLVDAETSEVHPSLSDGQRAYDLEILVENVAFGLADLAELHGRFDPDEAIAAAESVRSRYEALWEKLHETPELQPGDRQAVRKRIRKLNELGFSVDEINVRPAGDGDLLRL